MSAATMTETVELSISEIEDRLAELGYETEYYGDDDGTQFTVSIGDKSLNIFNGVSGDYFRPEHVTSADYWFGIMGNDQTEKFAEVETVDEFIYRVQGAMTVTFTLR